MTNTPSNPSLPGRGSIAGRSGSFPTTHCRSGSVSREPDWRNQAGRWSRDGGDGEGRGEMEWGWRRQIGVPGAISSGWRCQIPARTTFLHLFWKFSCQNATSWQSTQGRNVQLLEESKPGFASEPELPHPHQRCLEHCKELAQWDHGIPGWFGMERTLNPISFLPMPWAPPTPPALLPKTLPSLFLPNPKGKPK